jgi:hypothetical protein
MYSFRQFARIFESVTPSRYPRYLMLCGRFEVEDKSQIRQID